MAVRYSSMVTDIKESTKMENSMGKASTHGLMVLAMKASSSKARDTVREVGNQPNQMEIFILELIRMTKRMDMDVTFGQMDACMKEVLRMT